MTGMTLEIHQQNGGAVFEVGGRLMYESDSQAFHAKLNEQIAAGAKWIVVDLSRVIGMSSTGLGILIWAHRTASEQGFSLKLASLSDKVRSVLQITRLNSVFEVYESVEEAIQTTKG
jgi:anti-sigma B factor antagonist